jgi:hypothetical protein
MIRCAAALECSIIGSGGERRGPHVGHGRFTTPELSGFEMSFFIFSANSIPLIVTAA